jgi:hypothetical protein
LRGAEIIADGGLTTSFDFRTGPKVHQSDKTKTI